MKIKLIRFIIPTFLLVFGLYTLVPARALAYDITSLSVEDRSDFVLEPGKSEIFLNPGESVTKYIYVTNRIKGATKFKVEVEDFVGSRNPNQTVVLLGNGKALNSSIDYIQPDTKEFTLNFGQKIAIPVKVSLPNNVAPGGYYGSVLISNEPEVISGVQKDTTQNFTRVISRLGTLFFIRAKGAAKESGNLEDFRIAGEKQAFYEKGPLSFEILFNNDGNVHLVPYGNISVTNIFGHSIAELPVDAYFALPNSLRFRNVLLPNEFLIGRYTAKIHLNRGYKNLLDEKTITFWVLPWKLVLGIVFGVLIVITVSIFIFKNFELKKKQ